MSKDMRGVMLKIYILRRIGRSKVNSYAIFKDFSSRKSGIKGRTLQGTKNEVYNTIKSLERAAYIKSTRKIENGRLKNYYTLTQKGNDALKSSGVVFRKHLKELAKILKE